MNIMTVNHKNSNKITHLKIKVIIPKINNFLFKVNNLISLNKKIKIKKVKSFPSVIVLWTDRFKKEKEYSLFIRANILPLLEDKKMKYKYPPIVLVIFTSLRHRQNVVCVCDFLRV